MARKLRTTAIRAPDDSNHQVVLSQLKEVAEIGQRLRGDPLDSFVRVSELVDAGVLRILNGRVTTASTLADILAAAELEADLSGKADVIRQIIAGAGLTGGGDLSADRTVNVGAGTGIAVNANDVALSAASIASLLLADSSVQPARTLTAGAGLIGGGDLSANRTFDVGAGFGILSNTNDVAVDQTMAPTWTSSHRWTDNDEVQLGTDGDLRLYSDNTDVWVRADNGRLILSIDGNASAWIAASEALQIGNRLSAFITNDANPTIYSTNGAGSGIFNFVGHLVIQPQTSAARDIILAAGSTTPQALVRVGDPFGTPYLWLPVNGTRLELGASANTQMYTDGVSFFFENTAGGLGFVGADTIRFVTSTANGIELYINSGFAWGVDGSNKSLFNLADNREFRLGAGNDLRLYHDGTDSFIENDTGNLVLKVNGELDLEEVTTTTSAPSAGAAGALPATPAGYMTTIINGVSRQFAYY